MKQYHGHMVTLREAYGADDSQIQLIDGHRLVTDETLVIYKMDMEDAIRLPYIVILDYVDYSSGEYFGDCRSDGPIEIPRLIDTLKQMNLHHKLLWIDHLCYYPVASWDIDWIYKYDYRLLTSGAGCCIVLQSSYKLYSSNISEYLIKL